LDWTNALASLASGHDFTRADAKDAMAAIMAGESTDAQIAAFIVSLRIKGETIDELTGLVEAMRQASIQVQIDGPSVDLVGTGGDRSGSFNISTTASLIASAAGVQIAKHGNRSASSKAGSADVLEALGYPLALAPEATKEMVEGHGFGFFFARQYHPSMRHAGPVRSQLGIPTVFNFLGPLTNPSSPTRYAIGVSDAAMAGKMIHVLKTLGAKSAFVYRGEDGLDELSTSGPSVIHRLKNGEITQAEFTPEDFGVERASVADVLGGDVDVNAQILRDVLGGTLGPKRDIAVINASAAIVLSGLADGFGQGVVLAQEAIDSGAATAKLEEVVKAAQTLDN
jgi:anthranilate phosphoribosyltransferase